jgi:zinc protease
MLKQFHESWYGPNNAILVIAGDVDLPQTLALVTKLFSSIPPRPVPARPAVNLQPLKAAHIAFDTDLPYGLSVVAYRLPGYESPDFAAAMVLADVLASKRGNLFALVPEGKALFTDFDSEMLPKAGFALATAGFPEGANGDGLVTAIKAIIDGYIKDGLPPDLVAAAKRHAETNAQSRKNSIAGLAVAWSQALAVEGRTSPDDTIEAIKNVTVDDVNRVARNYLQSEQAVTAVLLPRPSGKPVASKGFGGGESFTPQPTTEVRLPPWAKKSLIVPALAVSNVKPADIKLANGIRLIVQTEKISPTITLLGQVKHNDNLQEPPGKEGVAALLENLFSYGTQSLDRLAFEKANDDISAEITAGASFSLRTQPDHFEEGLKLLADNLLRPALPEQAFLVVREETTGAVGGRLKSPGYLSQRALIKGLFPPHDPVLREATPETVSGISLDDVKSYHAKVFRPDMTTIVIIGDVTPARAREVVATYFGAWRAQGAKPVTDLPAVSPNKPSRHVVPDQSRVQDEVTLAQTLTLTRSQPDYYTLAFANHILSGAFYASRLYRDLRENAGLVYTVGSSLESGKHRSVFSVFYGCDPPNVSRARTMVEQNLRDLQKTPVTSKELKRAKILLLRQIPLAEASLDGIAAGLLARSIQDLPLDEPVRAAKYYRQMSASRIRGAVKKWIRPDDFVQVTEGSIGN